MSHLPMVRLWLAFGCLALLASGTGAGFVHGQSAAEIPQDHRSTASPPSFLDAGIQNPPLIHDSPGDTSPAGAPWHVVGSWTTIANGDDVRAVARSGDMLWGATAGGGVVRWRDDGALFKQYLAPQDGLPCNDVRDVIRWKGDWWFATCKGLARYDVGKDRMVGLNAPLPSPSVTALAVDDAGRLWAATGQWWDRDASFEGKTDPGGWTGGGVAYSADGVAWTVLDTTSGLSSNNVRDITVWRGNVWVAMEPYLRWQPPGSDAGGDPEPGRWQAYGGGVARRDAATWTGFDGTTTVELSDNARLLAGDARALWVGTGGRGLVAFDGGRWKGLRDCGNPSRCIQDNYVTALAIGDDDAIWLGTARFNGQGTGVNVLDARGTPLVDTDDAWTVVGAADGLPGDLVHAILPEADATVWFGTAARDPEARVHGRGLAHMLEDRATIETHSSQKIGDGALPDNDVTAIAQDPLTGALWVGTAREGLAVRSLSGRWTTHTRASTGGGLASDSIADILVEPGGIVWVATRQQTFDAKAGRWVDGGLSRFDGRSWTKLTSENAGLPSNHLSALALDGRGRLWVGTGATDRGPKEHAFRGWGLAVVNTQTRQWERTFTFPTLTSDNITDLAVQGGELWVATSYFFYVDPRPRGAQFSTGGGISIYNLEKGTWRKLTAADGLSFAVRGRSGKPGDGLVDMRTLHVDRGGNAWAGGLSYPEGTFDPDVTPDGVIDVVRPGGITSHRFPRSGAVVALTADNDANVWAASTLDGVRVWVEDQWLRQAAAPGGLPTDSLTALTFDANGAWLGTDGFGLIQLRPLPKDPIAGPAGSQPIIQRLPHQVYLPLAAYEIPPRILPAP
jgi:ligand-binding sensor domain-containing protein